MILKEDCIIVIKQKGKTVELFYCVNGNGHEGLIVGCCLYCHMLLTKDQFVTHKIVN